MGGDPGRAGGDSHREGGSKESLHDRDCGLRLVFKQAPGAIWATDKDLRITYAVGQLRDTTGLDDATIVGGTVAELLGTEDPTEPFLAHHLAALAGHRGSFNYDFRGRCYGVFLEPLRDAGHEIAGTVGVAVDITDRRHAEIELGRSEARLAQAQRVAHLGSWDWAVDSDVMEWSAELHRIHGLPDGQFGGTREAMLALVHPDDREGTRAALARAFFSGRPEPFSHSYRIVRPDGTIRMVQSRGELQGEGDGAARRAIGVVWDVTEQWQTTQALERSVSLLRATLEATADGLLVIDREGKVVAHNKSFLTMWRLPRHLLEARADEPMLEAAADQLEQPDAFVARVRELYDAPEMESFDVLSFKDGRVLERYSRPQRLGDEVVGRVWSFRDVTERERLMRRALFFSQASRLLNSLEVEPALESVAQLAVPYIGTACAIDLFADQAGPRRLLSLVKQPGRSIQPELPGAVLAGHSVVRTVDGTSQMTVPMINHSTLLGALTFAAKTPRRYERPDVELAEELANRSALAIENARLYRSAKDALEARDQFLSIAAHELRGPVTSLRLAVQTLRRAPVPPSSAHKLLELIEREEKRLVRFVDELLDVSQVRADRLRLHLEPVDLTEVAREAALRLGPDLVRSGSKLQTRIDGASAVGLWDRSRLDQVVTNLLSNAIKFGRGKPIELSISSGEGMAQLAVTDHGIGIPAAMQQRVFRPFERAVSARQYGGLGLGLYIVQMIVDAFGGTIRLHSEPEIATTFTVDLPQARDA